MHSSSISILVVEDDKSIGDLLLNSLEMLGFKNILTSSDGQDGLDKYHKHLPDIVVTDFIMPNMNGLDMSKLIKANNPDVPIILITAMKDNETLLNAINIGVDGYIFKPFDILKLKELIIKFEKRILLQKNFKTEHKLLEEYKGAIDSSAAVTKTDTNGIITYVNDSFCKMSGYSKEELVGRKHSIVKHPDTIKAVYLNMWKTITHKKVWQGRIKNLKKNGDTYYEYSVIVPIINEKNEIEEYISLRQDITDLFYQEQYLKKRIKEEVDKNLELHKEKEESNLLEEKFSTIGKMAAGITHEINTPLTYIRGNLELMQQDINNLSDDIKEKGYLQEDSKTIFDGVNRIASIVESMREMASQTKEVPQPSNIYASLITALTLSHNKAKFISNIMVQNEVFNIGMDKEKYSFIASIQNQRIEQVFVIIINNAIDVLKLSNDFDSRLLEITLEDKEDYILIKFQDNACGIDEEMLPKIFDPFQSNKEEGGMGIGLNVAKRIIDDHGGKIIPSNVNGGALFELYIPYNASCNIDEENVVRD